jgi:hypothetical protein
MEKSLEVLGQTRGDLMERRTKLQPEAVEKVNATALLCPQGHEGEGRNQKGDNKNESVVSSYEKKTPDPHGWPIFSIGP